MASSSTATKSQNNAPYELIYWPGLPGRGEHIRLAFEEAGVPYSDSAQTPSGMDSVLTRISASNFGSRYNAPSLAPPILKHGELEISQTSNILMYLGPRLGLVPPVEEDADAMWKINALVLTALDGFSNEVHDCHHPVASSLYYEDQKIEAKRKAADYISNRLPKFLGYFERVLMGQASGGGEYLYAGRLTYADLVLWQCLDGVRHAFPKAVGRIEKEGKFGMVFKLYERVKGREKIKAYLESERRQKYGLGIYRYYPELDEE